VAKSNRISFVEYLYIFEIEYLPLQILNLKPTLLSIFFVFILIASAKENETIFTEIDVSGWNEVGERKEKELTRHILQLCFF
jgi:hypothetical protein